MNGTTEIITYSIRMPSHDDFDEVRIGNDVFRLENEGGAWSGRGVSRFIVPSADDEETVDDAWWLLVGEDGYEGLSAQLSYYGETNGLVGVIIERPLPPVPEAPSGE